MNGTVIPRCGLFLDRCECPKTGAVWLSQGERAAMHREALARAARSGWGRPAAPLRDLHRELDVRWATS